MTQTQEQRIPEEAPASDLHTLLSQEHLRLNELFEKLVGAFRAGDRDEVQTLWNAFDAGLDAHMTLEETRILPEFAKIDPAEAAALAREHLAIRASLSEMGVAVDLHCMTLDAIDRFIGTLKEHAEREDALMYRWARANLSESHQRSIQTLLLAALRKLVGATSQSIL